MSNQIDGIRKLNKEELERSRKIVLDSIAEETRTDAPVVAPKNSSRLVDGVFSRPAALAAEKKVETVQKKASGRGPEKKYTDKIETEEKKTAPVTESPEERQRKAELRRSWRKEVESAMGASPRPGADEKKSLPKTRPETKIAPVKKTEENRKEEKRPSAGALKRSEENRKEKVRAAEEE